MLVAAAWIAVAANDRNVALLPQTEAERIAAEHAALLLAAQVRLRTAEERQGARAVVPGVARRPRGARRPGGAAPGRGIRSPAPEKSGILQ